MAFTLLLTACDLVPPSESAELDVAGAIEEDPRASAVASQVDAIEADEDVIEPAATIVASTADTGVVDVDGDGDGDYSSYGERNRGLSVGEQGGDGRNLRYVAPFVLDDRARAAIVGGSRVTLSFTIWRIHDLDGRKLVATTLSGRRGAEDFERDGTEVLRDDVVPGRMAVDVTDAVDPVSTGPLVVRFATDTAPVAGDGEEPQINIATADGRAEARPTLTIAGVPDAAEEVSEPAGDTPVRDEPALDTNDPLTDDHTTADAPRAPVVSPPPDSSLLWSDEFDGDSLDTRTWKPYHSTYGDGNNELQCHTPDNVSVSGGTVKLTARRQTVTCPGGSTREFTSGFLGTRDTGTYFPRYGRFEIRARVPHGQGLWPAFWLRHRSGSSTAEVDVMEYFHSQVPGESTSTLHLDGRANVTKKTAWFESPTSKPGWHSWAVDITRVSEGVKFVFFLDGQVIHSFVDTGHRWAEQHAGDDLWDIAVNLSVGGNWVGDPDDQLGLLSDLDRCAQGGSPPNCESDGVRRAQFPATYEVDYVRVYRD